MSRISVEARKAAERVVVVLIVAVALAFPVRTIAAGGADSNHIIDHLYGSSLLDRNTGWIVGAFGMVARTHDGGKTWQVQKSGTSEHLFDVAFFDTSNGWAVGRSGTIVHTSDAGDTWQPQVSATQQHLFSVRAISTQRAFAVGDWGTIISTSNGGKTWEARSIDRDVILNSQSWPDAQHGWVVGEAGTILVTSDGGTTWQDQQAGVEKTLFGSCFTDTQHGWVVGLDGMILRTTDGGATWEAQRGDTRVGGLEQVGAKAGVENPSLYNIALAGQIGYAVGEGGAVFVSEDGGSTWQRKPVPAAVNMRWIRSVSLVPGTHGLLVGANGLTIMVAGNQLSLPEN